MLKITTKTLSILHELNATLEIETSTIGGDKYVSIKIRSMKYFVGTFITMDEYKKTGTMVLSMLLCEFKRKAGESK